MPLIFNVRQVEKKPVDLCGELPIAELDLEGVDECVRVALPLKHNLSVQWCNNNFLIQGSLHTTLECTCVRCLKVFPLVVALSPWVCHLAREGEDCVRVINDCVDLTPYLREDILLSFPQHPLCEPGCNGLPHSASSSVHQDSGPHQMQAMSSAWAELNKLKL